MIRRPRALGQVGMHRRSIGNVFLLCVILCDSAACAYHQAPRDSGAAISNTLASQQWAATVIDSITGNWVTPPPEAIGDYACTASIEIAETGRVLTVAFKEPCFSKALERSIEAAIYRSSPLPLPERPEVFNKRITARFKADTA